MDYILNINGIGMRYVDYELDRSYVQEIDAFRQENHLSWETLFFDFIYQKPFQLLEKSGFQDREKVQFAYMINAGNRLQIKRKNTTIARITTDQLLQQNTLFPMYQVQIANKKAPLTEEKVCFRILQQEVGQLAKFSFSAEKFHWESLSFTLQPFNHSFYITDVYFQNEKLISQLSDTVVQSNAVLLV